MKYLALLSGGKDSCYNLLHCAKNGHELIAAASLAPESGKGSIPLGGFVTDIYLTQLQRNLTRISIKPLGKMLLNLLHALCKCLYIVE
jgi:diphthamide synthase (EF-2-diphthine--ammonia ligase)